ncbi:MAG: type II toxin-antitoxin system RelE family toxin [Alphaproteobacteria bacterium]
MQARRAADILTRLERIAKDPFARDVNIKPLKGLRGVYRLRLGTWRVSYLVDRKRREIDVFEVAPRGGAYR